MREENPATRSVTVAYPTLQAGEMYVIAARWIPSVENQAWINGVAQTPAAAPLDNYNGANTQTYILTEDNGNSGSISAGVYKAMWYDTAHSNAVLKDYIERLGARYGKIVDTSSITP
jgi:hypothetical protein